MNLIRFFPFPCLLSLAYRPAFSSFKPYTESRNPQKIASRKASTRDHAKTRTIESGQNRKNQTKLLRLVQSKSNQSLPGFLRSWLPLPWSPLRRPRPAAAMARRRWDLPESMKGYVLNSVSTFQLYFARDAASSSLLSFCHPTKDMQASKD